MGALSRVNEIDWTTSLSPVQILTGSIFGAAALRFIDFIPEGGRDPEPSLVT